LIHHDASHPEIIEILNTKCNDIISSYQFLHQRGLEKFVYIINFGADYYKIGITHSPSQRLRTFQSNNPFVSGTDSVIALFVYEDNTKRRKDADFGGLLRPSPFSKSKNPRSYHRPKGVGRRPYALLCQLEKSIHLWCIERGFAFDKVRKGNRIATEIFKLNPEELGELFKTVASWGFATIPRDELHRFVVPENPERFDSITGTILERKIS